MPNGAKYADNYHWDGTDDKRRVDVWVTAAAHRADLADKLKQALMACNDGKKLDEYFKSIAMGELVKDQGFQDTIAVEAGKGQVSFFIDDGFLSQVIIRDMEADFPRIFAGEVEGTLKHYEISTSTAQELQAVHDVLLDEGLLTATQSAELLAHLDHMRTCGG